MSNSHTTGIETTADVPELSASGHWSEDFRARPTALTGIRRVGQVAGVVLAIAVSPATAIPDPWWVERRRCHEQTVTWIIQSSIGRPISRAEALRIAQQILEHAERERLELAEWEAKRGIQWEDGA